MATKSAKTNPDNKRATSNTDYFLRVRGSKSTLLCKHKKPNPVTGIKDDIDKIVIEINNNTQKIKIELAPYHIEELVSDCLEAINNQSIVFEYGCNFLTKYLRPAARSACILMHDIMSCNPQSEIECLYDFLKEHAADPHSTIPSDVIDTEDRILYENALAVCRFKRQMDHVTSNLHESTEPLLLHIADTSDVKANADGDYWLNHSLVISYLPCCEQEQIVEEPFYYQNHRMINPHSIQKPNTGIHSLCDRDPIMIQSKRKIIVKMKQPWHLVISKQTIKTDGSGSTIENSKATKSVDMNLSDEDFKKFLSRICEESDIMIPKFAN